MPQEFDWQTEEDDAWDNLPDGRTAPPQGARRRPFLIAALVVVLIALAAWVVYDQVQERVAATTAAVTQDVRSSVALWQRAVATNDAELFDTLLSGSDLRWTEAQRTLFTADLLLDRTAFGLSSTGAASDFAADADVTLSPDLTAAEVVVAHPYAAPAARGAGLSESVTLQHTLVFRRGEQRWLYAPPHDEFWGAWETAASGYVTLTFPERDAALATRLLPDLSAAVARACADLADLSCPEELNLRVRLARDPQSLASVADPTTLLRGTTAEPLELPTPTLAGLPVDEAGYEALQRGYAAHVVAAAIVQSIGYACCEQGLFHQALIDKQLDQLGLRPWPLTPQAYGDLLRGPTLRLSDIGGLWEEPPAAERTRFDALRVYSVIDFVLAQPAAPTPAAVQRRLLNANDHFLWLDPYVDSVYGSAMQRDWLRHVQAQIPAASPPLPLPEQDVQAFCSERYGVNAALLRYDLRDDSWTEEISSRFFLFMHPLPDDSGVLLQERNVTPTIGRVLLWRNGREIPLNSEPFAAGLFRADTVGSRLVLYGFDSRARQPIFRLLDPGTCDAEGCDVQSVPSPPVWPPNEQQALVTLGGSQIWLSDARGRIEAYLGAGVTPFWLDNETYGFARIRGRFSNVEPGIVIGSLADETAERFLPFTVLAPVLPPGVAAANLLVRATAPDPHNPNLLLIVAAVYDGDNEAGDDAVARPAMLLSYDLQSGEALLREELRYELSAFNPLDFSPDGRWLVIKSMARMGSRAQLLVHHIASRETRLITSTFPFHSPRYDWSADGRWLLRAEEGYLHLFAPDFDYHRIIVHDYPFCDFAAWVNR